MIKNQYSYTYFIQKIYEPRGWYPEESKQKQELRQRNEWLQSISKKNNRK